MANDGSSPQCCSATVSIDVVEVLPWVPATAATRRPTVSAASAWARCTTSSPRSRAAASSGLVSRIAVETTTVASARQVRRVVADRPRAHPAPAGRGRPGSPWRRNRRPRRRGRAGCGRSRSSRRRRCRSGGPAPPVPVAVTASPPRRRAPAGPAARPRRRVPTARAALPAASSCAGSPSSGTSSASTRSPVSSASATSTPPPAATTGSALSACSPLPCGSGTYTAGRPTADTSATVIAPARQSTASAAA